MDPGNECFFRSDWNRKHPARFSRVGRWGPHSRSMTPASGTARTFALFEIESCQLQKDQAVVDRMS